MSGLTLEKNLFIMVYYCRFELLENKKEELLNSVGASFSKALELHEPDQCTVDERWLYHYMLGKVAEKRQKEPAEYLQHYLTVCLENLCGLQLIFNF